MMPGTAGRKLDLARAPARRAAGLAWFDPIFLIPNVAVLINTETINRQIGLFKESQRLQ